VSSRARRGRITSAAALGTAGALLLLLAPVVGIVWRAPWSGIGAALREPGTTAALRVSLVGALAATALALVLGVPLAVVAVRGPRRLRGPIAVAALLPLALPPVVTGIGLLAALGRRGVFGGALESVGVTLPFTLAGVVVAQTVVALPFVVAALDPAAEDAARIHGVSEPLLFAMVTLPALRPVLVAGGALGFARCLGEFGATITFAGSLGGRTETLPTVAYSALQDDPAQAHALAVLLLAVAATAIAALRHSLLHGIRVLGAR
jgi:molybdate transport system permease protein